MPVPPPVLVTGTSSKVPSRAGYRNLQSAGADARAGDQHHVKGTGASYRTFFKVRVPGLVFVRINVPVSVVKHISKIACAGARAGWTQSAPQEQLPAPRGS